MLHDPFPPNLPKIGLIGKIRSGKGTVSKILETNLHFKSRPLSESIRDYAKENNISLLHRNDFWNTRAEIIEKYSVDYFIMKTLQELSKEFSQSPTEIKGIVVDGFRILKNATDFKTLPHSLLIGITSKDELRYQRQRKERAEDNVSLEEFIEYDKMEGKQIDEIMSVADVILTNNETPEKLEKDLLDILKKFQF